MSCKIVSEVTIYPVKSCKGMQVSRLRIDKKGPFMDRRWMVVDKSGKAITQRTHPMLSQVHTTLDDRFLFLSVPAKMPLMIPLNAKGPKKEVFVWSRSCFAFDLGDEVASWLSNFLQTEVRFVFLPDDEHMQISEKYDPEKQFEMSFQDRMPFLLLSQASLDALTAEFGESIRMNRFRPNFVVKGCEPFEEESWKKIIINGVPFRAVKPATRCIVPEINQETAKRDASLLNALSSLRGSGDKKIQFGQLLIHEKEGMVGRGDAVEIIS